MKIRLLHKDIYTVGNNLTKRDKLGIHKNVEEICLDILRLSIDAAFRLRQTKSPVLELLRVKISVLKNLVRTEQELEIINDKTYLRISEQLVEISKMLGGWIKFLTQKER